MSRPTQMPLDRMAFPLTLRGELRATFADIVSSPLPRRLSALMRRLNADHDGGGTRLWASTTETSSRIDRRGRRAELCSLTAAISRSPRGQRPLSRTMFVLVAVSSINTSRAGSSMPCSRTQRRRARATSARFCSAACRLFFKADIVSIKETLESAPTAGDALFNHGGENLLEGQIRLFGNQSQDPVRMLFQWRNTPAAPFRRRAPCLTPALAPSNYRTNAHLEDLGYLSPRRSAFNRFNRTLTQVHGIRPRHRISSPGESISPDSPRR
jgi:hypothetical protein